MPEPGLNRDIHPNEFDQYACCYYHIDVFGHKPDDCRDLGHKLQDLIYDGVITIDWLNQLCEINPASHLDPPWYCPANPFIKGKTRANNPQVEGS